MNISITLFNHKITATAIIRRLGNQFLFVARTFHLIQTIIHRDEIQLYELSFGITGKMSQAGNLTLKNSCCYRTDVIAIPIKSQKRVDDDVLNLIFLNINAKLESN